MTSSGCSMTLKCPENVSSTSRAFVIARFITIILYAGVRPSQTPAISKVGWLIWWRRWPVEWASKSWNPRKNAFMLLELEQMPPKYCCQARSMYSLPYNFCKALLPKSTVSIRNMMPKKAQNISGSSLGSLHVLWPRAIELHCWWHCLHTAVWELVEMLSVVHGHMFHSTEPWILLFQDRAR